jgi:tRNA(Glu) U13 pseudouridine synthase TruD
VVEILVANSAVRTAPANRAGVTALRGILLGTCRHSLVHLDDLHAASAPEGICLIVTLPASSYTTVLLREVMKTTPDADEAAPEDS